MLDGLRDKRSVFSAFIFPLMAPVLVYGWLRYLAAEEPSRGNGHPRVRHRKCTYFDQLAERKNVKIEAFDGDPKTAVREKKKELVLVIPDMVNASPT